MSRTNQERLFNRTDLVGQTDMLRCPICGQISRAIPARIICKVVRQFVQELGEADQAWRAPDGVRWIAWQTRDGR